MGRLALLELELKSWGIRLDFALYCFVRCCSPFIIQSIPSNSTKLCDSSGYETYDDLSKLQAE